MIGSDRVSVGVGLTLSIPGKPPGGGQAVLPYRLARLRLPAGQGRPAATGVKLEKPGGDVYTVDTIPGLGHGCTCPSFRLGRKHLGGKGCKHIRALLAWGLIDPAEPVRGEDQEAALAHWAEDAARVAAEAQAQAASGDRGGRFHHGANGEDGEEG